MKKYISYLLSAVLILSLTACGNSQPPASDTAPDAAPETYKIKLSISEALDESISIEAVGAMAFKKSVEDSSNGAMSVEIFPGGTLGEADSVIDQTKNNIIQVVAVADAKIAGFYPEIQALSIPYLFTGREHVYKALDMPDSIITEMIDDMTAKTGLRIVSLGENGGFRCFSNNKRQVKTAADMAGLKIRTMNSPLHMDIVKNLGGVPTPLAISELYTALQTSACDGQENAPLVTNFYHFEEVQKYYTLDKHVYSITTFLVNEGFYESLPDNFKAIIDESGKNAAIAMRKACQERESTVLESLASKGMEIYEPTEAEMKSFQDATQQPAIDFLNKNIDQKWVEGILTLAKQSK